MSIVEMLIEKINNSYKIITGYGVATIPMEFNFTTWLTN